MKVPTQRRRGQRQVALSRSNPPRVPAFPQPPHPPHPPGPSPPLPLVVLLDLDGTLVGSVTSILCEHMLLLKTLDRPLVPDRAWKESVASRLRYGIIRPHVLKFCREIGPGVELFVYTASEQSWASAIIPCVESALGVRFNRPLFTRAQCTPAPDLKKSFGRVLPSVLRSLKKKWPAATLANMRDRVVLVDNTPTVMESHADSERMIVCPTYVYNYMYDVLRLVPVDVLHSSFSKLIPVLVRFGLFPSTTEGDAAVVGSYHQFASIYYGHLHLKMAEVLKANRQELKSDGFFAALLTELKHALAKPGATFAPRTVRLINQSVQRTQRTQRTLPPPGRR
jgi:hypothetical protein